MSRASVRETRRSFEQLSEMPRTPAIGWGERWTTQDELHFLREMAAHRNIKAMRGYVATAHLRDWHSPGLAVDPAIVILTAKDLLEDLEMELRGEELDKLRREGKLPNGSCR